ncbi:GntR family transcriptional regulator [Microbacterium sp. NPDC076911]|uniref:GntR family transcriptional regulator n=1 Tax=Microbacterium sp. NPDC076911 TaxID=3154958 RepID=UPI00342E6FEE
MTSTPQTARASHGSTGAMIATSLREAILSGEYAPGERVRQDELAEQHGASRLPVREALRMLEAEGLIVLVANTGAWVSHLTMAECEELYQMRERLEPLLLRLNVPVMSAADVTHLKTLADAMERTDDVEEFIALDREFHLSCLRAAPTTLLGAAVLNLWNRTQHYRRAATRFFYASHNRSVHHDHQLIVNAIGAGDADEAEQSLSRHIRRSRLELMRHPAVFDDPTPGRQGRMES